MAVQLVPYTQDEKKWTDHYLAQAMKQMRPTELTKQLKEQATVHPSLVLPTTQLVAQAQSEMKREKQKQTEIYAPVLITPEFEEQVTPSTTVKENTRKKTTAPRKKTAKKANHKRKKDIFD